MARISAREEVYQQTFWPEQPDLERVVNVSSVAQLSPFRYPGGKTWLVPRSIRWLKSQTKPAEFIEPFAGGAITGLTVADLQLADHVTLVEKDEQVASVWRTILGGGADWLANEIMEFDVTKENVECRLNGTASSDRELAFRTILKNRTFHGGILAPGSSVLKHGENGKGIRSRWYPETLRNRILKIATLADRISIVEGDGIEVMKRNADRDDAVYFIDPPYTAAGKKAGSRLYTHSQLDHQALFEVTSQLKGDFLMTYDDAEGVRELAERHSFTTRTVAMRNTHLTEMTELLIGRNLNWVNP
ncbi:MAG: DNA adenine methylase [Acidobacteriota bacterium]